jgi:hypothetical protein
MSYVLSTEKLHSDDVPVPVLEPGDDNDSGLVAVGVGIRARATESFGPVRGESLDMLRVEAVAERMSDHFVGHHAPMPCIGKTAQPVVAGRSLEDSLHGSRPVSMLDERKTAKKNPAQQLCR